MSLHLAVNWLKSLQWFVLFFFTKSSPRFRCTLALNLALSVAAIESPRYGGPLQVMASPLQFSSCGYCACGYNLSLFTWNMKLSCFSCCVPDCSQCLYCCGQDLVSWYTAIRYVKLCRLCRAYPLSAVNEVNNNRVWFHFSLLAVDLAVW